MDFFNKSKIRAKILSLFFLNGNSRFYLSEIARKVGTSGGTCRRELERLIKIGVLEKFKKYNLVFYELNSCSPYSKELKGLFNKTLGIPEILKGSIANFDKVLFAFIFGSYASAGVGPESDIDIFLIGEIDESSLLKNLRKSEELVGREIDYSIYSLLEFKKGLKSNSFIKETVKNFILLKGDENEFKRLLGKFG